jgi:sugar diacid utilization regulator
MTTERWNDEMLDELAESVEQTNYNLELLVGAVSGLLEQSRQSFEDSRRRDEEAQRRDEEFRQYKLENDQRFTVLLEEVRFLIRQLGENR